MFEVTITNKDSRIEILAQYDHPEDAAELFVALVHPDATPLEYDRDVELVTFSLENGGWSDVDRPEGRYYVESTDGWQDPDDWDRGYLEDFYEEARQEAAMIERLLSQGRDYEAERF